MKQIVVVALMGFTLGACAAGARTGAMVAELQPQYVISEGNALRNAVELSEVDGGKDTNPLWTSEVGNEEFSEALRQSLAMHTMLANSEGDSKYVLKAELLKVKQPILGFNFTVKSDVHYVLTEREGGKVLFDQQIHAEYTTKIGDALLPVRRLQLTNEGSIQENISTLIQMLIDQSRDDQNFKDAETDLISQISVPDWASTAAGS